MGQSLSTLMLMGGLVATTVFDAEASIAADKRNWPEAKKWAIISASTSLGLVLFALVLLVASRGGSPLGDLFIGMDVAFILCLLALIAIAILNIFAMTKNETEISKFAAGASALAAISFVLSLIVIIFLM